MRGTVQRRSDEDGQPEDADRGRRGRSPRAAHPEQRHAAAVPDRGRDRSRRGDPAAAPHPRPATGPAAARAHAAARPLPVGSADVHRERLPRDRDPVPGEVDAGRGPRLPRPQPPAPRILLRPAAVAADHEAAAHDRRLRPLFSDRSLLPRRGPARGSPARVHPGRPRDVLRRASRRSWASWRRSPCAAAPTPRASSWRGPSSASPTPTPWRATAATSPTRASSSSWWT